jgi:hypothetical protein
MLPPGPSVGAKAHHAAVDVFAQVSYSVAHQKPFSQKLSHAYQSGEERKKTLTGLTGFNGFKKTTSLRLGLEGWRIEAFFHLLSL